MKFNIDMSYGDLVTETTRNIEIKARSIVGQIKDENNNIITLGKRIDMLKSQLGDKGSLAFTNWVKDRNLYTHGIIHDFDKRQFIDNYYTLSSALERIQDVRNESSLISKTSFSSLVRMKSVSYSNNSNETLSPTQKWLMAPFMLLYLFLEDIFSFDGPRMIMAIIRLFFIGVLMWMFFIAVWPFIYTLYPLYALIISFFQKVYTKVWLGISVLGTTYSIFNWKTEWLSFSLLEYFPSFSTWLIWLFAINVISGLVALFILVRPWIEKLDKKS
ncbi:MAG: hypothetical protein JNL95_03725 [Chitinophagales bacterium]|nr:hypothetical protein [Chitinophagales bacterium]